MTGTVFGGSEAHIIGQAKREKTLTWIYRWGYTTPRILEILFNLPQPAIAKMVASMIKREQLQLILSPSDYGFFRYEKRPETRAGKRVEKRVQTGPWLLVLTDAGESIAASVADKAHVYPDYRRLPKDSVRHDLICQRVVANMLTTDPKAGGDHYVDYWPEAYASAKSSADVKEPDCVLQDKNMYMVGLEIELSAKTGRRLDQALTRVAVALQNGDLDSVTYLFSTKHLAESYAEVWAKPLTQWRKNDHEQWVINKQSVLDTSDVGELVTFAHRPDLAEKP